MNRTLYIIVVTFLFVSTPLFAQKTKVVVIPLLENSKVEDGKDIQTVVTVSRNGGDFENLIDAIDSINDASQFKRYIILLAPGDHFISESVVMKPFVDIKGSGRESTRLRPAVGAFSSVVSQACPNSSMLIKLFENSILSNLSIRVSGLSTNVVICNDAGFFDSRIPIISNIDIRIIGGNIGNTISGIYSSQFLIAEGIDFDSTAPRSVGFLASTALSRNEIRNSNFRLIGCSECGAIRAIGAANVSASAITATMLGSPSNPALSAESGSHIIISSSAVLKGTVVSADELTDEGGQPTSMHVFNSSIANGADGIGEKLCLNSNNAMQELNGDCSAPVL